MKETRDDVKGGHQVVSVPDDPRTQIARTQ